MITFDAHFDGEHLCPDQPVSLPVNVPLEIVVREKTDPGLTNAPEDSSPEKSAEKSTQALHGEPARSKGWLAQLVEEHGLIEGPADWSAELDHYLYGTPKRGTDPGA